MEWRGRNTGARCSASPKPGGSTRPGNSRPSSRRANPFRRLGSAKPVLAHAPRPRLAASPSMPIRPRPVPPASRSARAGAARAPGGSHTTRHSALRPPNPSPRRRPGPTLSGARHAGAMRKTSAMKHGYVGPGLRRDDVLGTVASGTTGLDPTRHSRLSTPIRHSPPPNPSPRRRPGPTLGGARHAGAMRKTSAITNGYVCPGLRRDDVLGTVASGTTGPNPTRHSRLSTPIRHSPLHPPPPSVTHQSVTPAKAGAHVERSAARRRHAENVSDNIQLRGSRPAPG